MTRTSRKEIVIAVNDRQHKATWPIGAGKVFAEKYPLFMRMALLLLWCMAALAVFQIVRSVIAEPRVFGQDSHAYWLAAQGELEYSRPAGMLDAYLYSPAFLTLITPLTWLPWPAFLAVWTCLLTAIALWLVKPLNWKWALPLFVCSLPEILVSNIFLLLALAAVVGIRWPAAWAFAFLTKVTMGVGLLWFAARGEWGRFAQGLGATALVVTVSYIADPSSWHAWAEFLLTNRDGTKDGLLVFALRCVLAVTLVVIGARRNWAWLIPLAMLFASPVLVSIVPAALLLAIPRLALAVHRRAITEDRPALRMTNVAHS